MSFFSLWVIIIIVITIVRTAGKIGNAGANQSQKTKPGNRQPVKPQQRSFAAMPQQKKVAPNVERNCAAEDKHRYENNVSNRHSKRSTATPNVQSPIGHSQPKMTGNRKPARQLYIGDAIPRGMKVVTCSYCAADNLVPYGAGEKYKCYFCHYDI